MSGMNPGTALPRIRRSSSDVDDPSACAVCAHRLDDHDATGLRYCQATQAQALPRNCICRDE